MLSAPWLVQAHLAFGLAALLLGGARVAWPHPERVDRTLGWSFLGLLLATAGTAVALDQPTGTPQLLGVTLGHAFVLVSAVGAAAAVIAAREAKRLLWRNIVTALFAGVLIMAGLFELTPGRLLNTVLAGH